MHNKLLMGLPEVTSQIFGRRSKKWPNIERRYKLVLELSQKIIVTLFSKLSELSIPRAVSSASFMF